MQRSAYAGVFRELADAIVLTSPDGCVTGANRAAVRLFGGDPAGRNVAELLDGDRPAHVRERWEGEVRVRTLDGRTPVCRLTVSAAEDGTAVLLFRRRRREPTRPELAVRGLARTVERFVAQSPVLFCVFSEDRSKVYHLSDAYERIFGGPVAEAVDRFPGSLLDPVHPDDARSVRQALRTTPPGSFAETYRIVRPDGEIRWLRTREFPIADEDGRTYLVGAIAEDVTDLLRAEALAGETRERFLRSLDALGYGGVALGPRARRIVESTPAFARILGLDEVPGTMQALMRHVHPEDRDWFASLLDETRAGRTVAAPFRVVGADGSQRWVEARWIPTLERGALVRVDGIVVDINERKLAELERERLAVELEVQRLHADGIGESLQAVWWSVDGTFRRMIDISNLCASVLGVDRREILAHPLAWRRHVHPEDLSKLDIASAARVIASGEPMLVRYRYVHPSKGERHHEVRVRAVLLEDGSLGRVDGITTDITDVHLLVEERRVLMRELEDRRTRIAELFDAFDDVFVALGPTLNIVEISPNCERVLGIGRDELMASGADLRQVVPEDRAVLESAAFIEELRSKGAVTREFRIVRPDGEERWIEHRLRAVTGADGRFERAFGSLSDITERKRGEAEAARIADALAASQRMESLGRMASHVAHDVNHVLGVVMIASELAMREVDAAHPATPFLDEILDAARRAAGLTSALLEFARGGSAQPEIVDLAEAVRRSAPVLSRLVGEGRELRIRTAPASSVLIAPVHLEQILANLTGNAADAMDPGGVCEIEVGGAPGAWLSVRDSGHGMPTDVAERALEPFFTTKAGGGGMGLGLSIVYGLVTQAGGTLDILSRPGIGSRVLIRFPSAKQPRNSDGQQLLDPP